MIFRGKVITGENIGSKFGIATANIAFLSGDLPAPEGVYFVYVKIQNFSENVYPAIMHYGARKTFGALQTIEVHILDFSENILGEELSISVKGFCRAVKKFQNADALFTQIEKDVIVARKFFIRKKMKKIWQDQSQKIREIFSSKAEDVILQDIDFQKSNHILAYASDKYEIDFIRSLMQKFPKKSWYFPVVRSKIKIIDFYLSSVYPESNANIFGISEPESINILEDFSCIDFAFIPSLGMTADGVRLGRGGGYYDKLLKNKNFKTVSVLPSFAKIDYLSSDNHDVQIQQPIFI